MDFRGIVLETLIDVIKQRKLSVSEVCKTAKLQPNMVNKIQNGERNKFDLNELYFMSQAAGVDVFDLMEQVKKKVVALSQRETARQLVVENVVQMEERIMKENHVSLDEMKRVFLRLPAAIKSEMSLKYISDSCQ